MNTASAEPDPLDMLAESFLERYRRGESPSPEEYAAQHPELADRIRALFPTLLAMEELQPARGLSAVVAPPSEGPVPQRLGEYRIVRELGRGGMGVVYEAVQEPLGRRVALKVMPSHAVANPTLLERFRREARAAARLHHTNIVPVFGIGEHEGTHFYAMQFIQGQGLEAVLQEVRRLRGGQAVTPGPDDTVSARAARGMLSGQFSAAASAPPAASSLGAGRAVEPAPPSELSGQTAGPYYRSVARLGVQAAEALDHAHRHGVLHRDVKPSNLLLDTEGTIWVTDFGLARADDSDTLTHSGEVIGTLRYMAPERFAGRADARSDVYSLGLTLYELLALRPAFGESDRARLIERVLHETPAAPRRLDPALPRDLETIVLKATARESEQRYPTAAALAEDLRQFLAGRPIRARRTGPLERCWRWCRRNPLVASLTSTIALLLLVLAIGASLMAWSLQTALKKSEDERQRADGAKNEAKEGLFAARLAQARANRKSGQIGQRFESLKAVAEATAIARELRMPAARFDDLRTEAIAALALPDLEVAREWDGWPEDTVGLDFDDSLKRYVRLDKQGGLTVCRLTDRGEEVLARIPGHGQPLFRGPWLSRDGRYVLVGHGAPREGGPAAVFRVWKLDGPEPQLILDEKETVYEFAVAFRPGGRQLAVGHTDKSVSVYDLATRQRIHRLRLDTLPHNLTFPPNPADGRLAVACGNAVRIFDIDQGQERKPLRHPPEVTWTTGLAWHPGGRRLATSCGDGKIYLWEVESAALRTLPWEVHPTAGFYLAFNHAGDRLVSEDWTEHTRLWDAVTGRLLLTSSERTGLRFSRDDAMLGSGRSGGKVRLYRVAAGHELRMIRRPKAGPKESISCPVLDAGGRILAAGTSAGLSFFDFASGQELAALQRNPRTNAIPSRFHRTWGWVIGVEKPGVTVEIALWPSRTDPHDPNLLRIGPPRGLGTNPLVITSSLLGTDISADGRVLAVAAGEKGAFVLHLDQPGKQLRLEPQYDVRSVAVSPNGRWVVTCSWWEHPRYKSVRIWDAASGAHVHDLPLDVRTGATFSPNSRWLATATFGLGGKLWEVGTWREVRKFDYGGFAFSPDSRLLAIGERHGVIQLSEVETGREIARLTFPEPSWYGPAFFSPDGAYLLAVHGENRGLYVWDLRRIREQLAGMGLDWDQPPYPPANPRPPTPLRVEIVKEGPGGGSRP
jgi:serine/threonine protein kinase/WD40 repeat protein